MTGMCWPDVAASASLLCRLECVQREPNTELAITETICSVGQASYSSVPLHDESAVQIAVL